MQQLLNIVWQRAHNHNYNSENKYSINKDNLRSGKQSDVIAKTIEASDDLSDSIAFGGYISLPCSPLINFLNICNNFEDLTYREKTNYVNCRKKYCKKYIPIPYEVLMA